MSFIGSVFSNNKGSGYQAGRAGIDRPTTIDQANTAYNQTQSGLNQQQAFVNALNAQNGIGNQSAVFNQQQNLAKKMEGVADGTGPNPAARALEAATGANTANTAAAMAGMRGTSGNPGMMARSIGNMGAANQQNAAGQSATMQAQQQIAGMNALSGQQQAMGNTAGTQVAQQQGALNAYNQSAQNQQGNLLNSINAQNNTDVNMQSNVNNANAGIAGINAQNQGQMLGGLFSGVSQGLGRMAEGGVVKNTPAPKADIDILDEILRAPMAHGGKVPALVSPGEKYLPPKEAKAVATGAVSPAKVGKTIPGKAKVAGDSYANDTVPATLRTGGVVIPRSIMTSKDAEKKAAAFVRAHLAKSGLKGKKK